MPRLGIQACWLNEKDIVIMQAVRQHLAAATGHMEPFRSVTLRLSTDDETRVAPTLQRISAEFKGAVGIGSYPASDTAHFIKVLLLLLWLFQSVSQPSWTTEYRSSIPLVHCIAPLG